MKKILLGLSTLICSFTLTAATVWVTNTNNTGAGSFRTAMQSTAQNGDVIRFDPSLIANGSDTIMALTPIYTNKDVTIVGLYNNTDTLFFSGGGTGQILYIDHNNSPGPTKSIELDSVVMIDGSASRGGHMFFIGDYVTIKNSVFRNGKQSTGTTLEGGSICLYHSYATPSVLVIENSQFYNNKSENGGAILTKYFKDVTINNSNFHNNEATNQGGGAVAVLTQSNVTINNSSFYDNTTVGNGGGLYCTNVSFNGAVVNLNVNGSSFYNNTASKGGGIGVEDVKPTVNIKTSTFNNNNVTTLGGGLAIFTNANANSLDINVDIENSTIIGNTNTGTSGVGSGVFIENSTYNSVEFLTIKGSIIADNGDNTLERNIRFSGVWNNAGSGCTSNGHNLIGEPSIRNTTLQPTDIVSVTGAQLNLGTIQNNGGFTPTMLPGTGSIALNKGDTLDVTAAQNGAITDGFRDVGAAEYFCIIPKTINPVACVTYTSPSGNYTWTTTGIYNDTVSVGGCDTIYTINLAINNSSAILNEIACDSYTSPSGKTWTVSNTYLDTIANASGCDSLMTINLTINTKTTSTITEIACGSYTSPSGKTWAVSNTYIDTIPNAANCDSVITVVLTVNQPTSSTISPIVCASYTSPNGKIWTASNTYMDTIPNAANCDSVITINLTVNQTSSSFSANSCGNYTSPSGKVITTSGIISDTITNGAGCDSVMTINVTVTNINVGVTRNGITLTATQSGATYKWLNCSNNFTSVGASSQAYTPIANNDYAVEVTLNGCVDTSNCYVVSTVGVNEVTSINNVVLYPNPTNGIVTVKSQNSINSITVISLEGKILFTSTTSVFSIENLTEGTYIIRVSTNEGIINKLITKN
jgi:hypothetical protein